MAVSVGVKFFARLLRTKNGLKEWIRLSPTEELFHGEVERELFQLVNDHVLSYGQLPSKEVWDTVAFDLPTKGISEPPRFYLDQCRQRFVHQQLLETMVSAEKDLNNDSPDEALKKLTETVGRCKVTLNANRMFEFNKDSHRVLARAYSQKLHPETDESVSLGFPTLDNMSGGVSGGDLVTFVGTTGAGKTFLMLHSALHNWQAGRNPMFVSMEMKPLLIFQRAAAMWAKIPITPLIKGTLSAAKQENLFESLAKLKDPGKEASNFWVLDGAMAATVEDVRLMCHQMKPSILYIDGAYLLKSNRTHRQHWEKLQENAEAIKSDIATELDIPVVISYQFRKGDQKKKTQTPKTLEDIAGTHSIAQLSSIVLGLLQEESIETLRRRVVEILKGRYGESGSFMINWNFDQGPDFMNFSEVIDPDADLSFM